MRAGPADTRGRVVRSALRLFAAKGFQATGIREIAKAANVSSASLYHYMGTKEDLLVGIMQEMLSRWLHAARLACGEVHRPEEKLVAYVRVHVISSAVHQLESIVIDNELRSLSRRQRDRVVALRDGGFAPLNIPIRASEPYPQGH